jgi:fluoride exporter
MHPFAVALGGAVGTLLRLLLTTGDGSGTHWDPRISAINVVGAFLLGVLVRLPVRPRLRSLLGSGGLGSLTSFSALSIAFVDGTPGYAVALGLLTSIVLGVAAAALGMWLGGLLTDGGRETA